MGTTSVGTSPWYSWVGARSVHGGPTLGACGGTGTGNAPCGAGVGGWQLVLRLGRLDHLAEFGHLPRGLTQGGFGPAFSGSFAPVIIQLFALWHIPVSELSILQSLHEDNIFLFLELDLLRVRDDSRGRCGTAGWKGQRWWFLEDGFQGGANTSCPSAGACCSGHLSPRLPRRFVCAGTRRLTSVTPFIDSDSNGRPLMATAYRKGVAWWRLLGLGNPAPATRKGTLRGRCPP
eukprot:4592676-Amphidinium_carterae.1